MTNNDKILIQDLAARLPYGVICKMSIDSDFPEENSIVEVLNVGGYEAFVNTMNTSATTPLFLKPFLRPMSSMTKEEKEEENKLWNIITTTRNDLHYLYTDFLLSHHLDFRGLIPMGLAIEATEGMY